MESPSKIEKLLGQPNILINDEKNVTKKIIALQKGTTNKLHVVADFDFTLTHCRDPDKGGEELWSSFGAVEFYWKFSDEFRNKLVKLYNHYAPIDADPSVEKEEKINLIQEWNRLATEVYKSEHLTHDLIREAVAVSKLKLRGGFKKLAQTISNAEIPFLILSAGLGDSIDHVLANSGISLDNVTILSNYFTFDDSGYVNGLTKPLITTGSKGKLVKEVHPEYFNSVKERNNLILLGDRIEDLQMASCFDGSCDNILTIGFLNEKVAERKDLYLNSYDVVLIADPDLSWIQMLMEILS